jgi:hypothetical protein
MRYRRTIFALRNVTADGDGSDFSAQDGVMFDCCRCVRGLFPRQNERRKFCMVFTPCADLAGDGEGAERLRRRHDALQWSAATLNGEESRTWHDNDVTVPGIPHNTMEEAFGRRYSLAGLSVNSSNVR